MNTQTTLKATLLLTVLAMLTACGAQKSTESSDLSSRAFVTSTTSSSAKPLLLCNQKSQDGLTASLKVYTNSANQIRNDYMTLKFSQMPSSFGAGDYIQLFRWQANSSNQIYLDPIPVKARFETLDGRAITDFSSVLYWGQVSALAKELGLTDVNAFFAKVRLVVDVRDPQANFDVLKIAMYNTNNTNTVNMDMLMPAFSANPNDYASDGGEGRASSLQALHPFAAHKGQNWTSEQYASMGTSFCF